MITLEQVQTVVAALGGMMITSSLLCGVLFALGWTATRAVLDWLGRYFGRQIARRRADRPAKRGLEVRRAAL